uniref:Fibronectin type-III domain-containing protein n=1 Tax=Glossina palpalis gambiensis TaxID=67801 RepID=A0A1B0BGF3_9MUSC
MCAQGGNNDSNNTHIWNAVRQYLNASSRDSYVLNSETSQAYSSIHLHGSCFPAISAQKIELFTDSVGPIMLQCDGNSSVTKRKIISLISTIKLKLRKKETPDTFLTKYKRFTHSFVNLSVGTIPATPENITITFLTPTTVRVAWQTMIDLNVHPVEKYIVTYKPTDDSFIFNLSQILSLYYLKFNLCVPNDYFPVCGLVYLVWWFGLLKFSLI